MKKRYKKTLLSPKVRLLLAIHLTYVKRESNYLAKVSRILDYSEGSTDTLIKELLDNNLIVSSHPDKVSPPYTTSEEARKFLAPIFLIRKVGVLFTLFMIATFSLLLLYYADKPLLLVYWWLPTATVGFSIVALVLLLYPHILVKLGKISY